MALVFQYGSNMLTSRLNSQDRLRGDARPIGIAKTVEFFEFDFTVWSKRNCCAAADLVSGKGVNIWGVLYEIPDFLIFRKTAELHKRKSLDAIEGQGNNYKRINISLTTALEEKVSAISYVVREPQAGLQTSLKYAQYIMRGIKEHDIPKEHEKYILARIIQNNSELSDNLVLRNNGS